MATVTAYSVSIGFREGVCEGSITSKIGEEKEHFLNASFVLCTILGLLLHDLT